MANIDLSVKKEILKTTGFILLFLGIVIYRIMNFSAINKASIFSIIAVILLFIAVYLFLLKNNLEQLKNDYYYEKNEHNKKYEKEIVDTRADLEKRGMTFSGEAVQKLGKLSAYKEITEGQSVSTPLEFPFGSMPIGEINQNHKNYDDYRIKKFELDFKRAKYKVLINLLKK